jgi:hypothetical protein
MRDYADYDYDEYYKNQVQVHLILNPHQLAVGTFLEMPSPTH